MVLSANGLFGFTNRAITLAPGTSSESISTRLGDRSRLLTPVRLPPGRARLATRPNPTGSPPEKTIGIVEVAPFAATAGGVPLRPAVFYHHVLSFDPAGSAESLAECGCKRSKRTGRPGAEKSDHRHRLLLRAPRGRRRHRAAQQQHQLAAVHSMTSSARSRG